MGNPTLATTTVLLAIVLASSVASQTDTTSKPRKPDDEAKKQVPPPGSGASSKPAGEGGLPQLLDTVLATVDKKAILLSDVRPEYQAHIAGLRGAGQTVILMSERLAMMRRILVAKVEQATMAQAARNLGGYAPKDVEAWLERHTRSEMERSIQSYGSLNKFRQELERFGTSTFAEQEKIRQKALLRLLEQDMRKNIGDHMNLMVTPTEMRDLWKKVRKVRARAPSTTLSIVDLPTRERARLLVAAWTGNEATAEEMTQKTEFPGAYHHEKKIQRRARRNAPPFMIDFAAAARLGEVSRPYSFSKRWWVLKATEIDPGDAYGFQEPHVQQALRNQIAHAKLERLHRRQTRRSRGKISRWQIDLRQLPVVEFLTPEEQNVLKARRATQRTKAPGH